MIRPFQLGDIYLIQRLSGQATQLPCLQTFLQPMSSMSVALSAVWPWTTLRAFTYVLRQQGHGLVHEGFLQMVRRTNRPEAEILCLAPSLDAPTGHPAIWNKLLSHLVHEAGALAVNRLYAEVPDQPLLVNTFAAVGFQPYCRQTIWRCFDPGAAARKARGNTEVRLRAATDDWDLLRLYTATVPEPVQIAEGAIGGPEAVAPLLENLRPAQGVTYVMRSPKELIGAFQVLLGQHGTWLQIWIDTLQPDSSDLRALISHALAVVTEQRWSTPLYIASSDFHGGLDIALEESGFAPFHDRVRMVKHVVKWVRENVSSAVPVVETTSEVVPTSFAPPVAPSHRRFNHLQPSIQEALRDK
ncbi:MAG: hypothetical protein IAE81_06475 [Caldilineaceae bacterium]|nr:hypothetical protein [Caldilineaceae bacterium]